MRNNEEKYNCSWYANFIISVLVLRPVDRLPQILSTIKETWKSVAKVFTLKRKVKGKTPIARFERELYSNAPLSEKVKPLLSYIKELSCLLFYHFKFYRYVFKTILGFKRLLQQDTCDKFEKNRHIIWCGAKHVVTVSNANITRQFYSLIRGNQRRFPVKHLFGEANIA